MKELKNIIFDYQDTIYQNEDPLFFTLRCELHHAIRHSFYLLNDVEKIILQEIVLKKKSIVNTALMLNMKQHEIERKLDCTLELLYHLFSHKYFGV